MKKINKYLLAILISSSIILISTLFLSILSYFNIVNAFFNIVFKTFIPVFAMFIGGIIIGLKSNKKGYLEGIKYSILFLMVSIILNIIYKNTFSISVIIYYIIIVITSMFGSCLGISKKPIN